MKPTPRGIVSYFDGSNGYFDQSGGYFVETPTRHGGSTSLPLEALTADDHELMLVQADMDVWAEAHPCDCEASCECE